jgi:hypothetical protein
MPCWQAARAEVISRWYSFVNTFPDDTQPEIVDGQGMIPRYQKSKNAAASPGAAGVFLACWYHAAILLRLGLKQDAKPVGHAPDILPC